MKIKTIKIKEYTLDEEEAKMINNCLKYCYHRMSKHNKHIVNNDKIVNLINQFVFEEIKL